MYSFLEFVDLWVCGFVGLCGGEGGGREVEGGGRREERREEGRGGEGVYM